MVQGQARHHVVERAGIGELLEPHTLEDGTFGCPWVDRGHGVTGTRHGPGQLPLPATHLQHPGRRVTDLVEDELLDALLPPLGLTHAAPYPPNILLLQSKRMLREYYETVSSRFRMYFREFNF